MQNVPETIEVELQTVERLVEFKGHIEAEKVVKLGFERSGIVEEVNVGVGDVVAAGAQLAKLDTRATELEVSKAFAARVSARDAARVAMEAAQTTVDATQADNERLLEQKRQVVRNAKAELDQAKEVRQQSVIANGDESVAAKAAYADVLAAETAYNAAQEDLKRTQTTVDKANQGAGDQFRQAEEAYLAAVQASGTVGGLSTTEVNEQQAQVQLEKDTLTVPISGTVTEVAIEPSEVAVAGQPLITVQTTDRKEITADLDETDLRFVRVGMTAQVEFDAFPGEEWQSEVVKVDPVGKIEDGDVTYKVTLRLVQDDERLLPALTARVKIMAGEKTKVVAVPELSLEKSGSEWFAHIVTGSGSVERRAVQVGLVGTNGLVEITNGLSAGEALVRRPE